MGGEVSAAPLILRCAFRRRRNCYRAAGRLVRRDGCVFFAHRSQAYGAFFSARSLSCRRSGRRLGAAVPRTLAGFAPHQDCLRGGTASLRKGPLSRAGGGVQSAPEIKPALGLVSTEIAGLSSSLQRRWQGADDLQPLSLSLAVPS